MAEKLRIGWIGTGVMGSSMAGHLLAAGWPLTVYSRTKAKADALLAKGAQWAESPRAVAAASDIVFSIVGFPKDVEEVMLGENGALRGLAKGGIVCDMTTSTPALGTLIHVAGTSNVASAYAATYPIALIAVVLVSQLIVRLF